VVRPAWMPPLRRPAGGPAVPVLVSMPGRRVRLHMPPVARHVAALEVLHRDAVRVRRRVGGVPGRVTSRVKRQG
jgi:hypothetical protein